MKRAIVLAAVLATNAAWGLEIGFKHTEIADGLYVIEAVGGFGGGNMAVSVGEDGVVLIDDGVPPLAETLVAAIAEITDQPVDFVVNTHVHGDHIGANELLAASGTTVIAHDNLRKRLVADGIRIGGQQQSAPKGMLPVLTFSDAVTFHLNGQEAYVFHVKDAHTDGDAIIHYRSLDVIHSGDVLFNGIFPFIDLDNGGTVEGFIKAQERIVAVAGPDTQIIAGHGPMATRDDVQASIDMLKTARSRVAEHIAAGKSVDEIVAADPLADYESWNWQFITAERMVRTIHRSLSN